MDVSGKNVRVKRTFKNPNPLFLSWLQLWKEEAKRNDSKIVHTYSKCIKSLSSFPLPLKSGKACAILKGFGSGVCAKLDKKLEEYTEQHGALPSSETRLGRNTADNSTNTKRSAVLREKKSDEPAVEKKTSKVRHDNQHVETVILCALRLHGQQCSDFSRGVAKSVLCRAVCQRLCASNVNIEVNDLDGVREVTCQSRDRHARQLTRYLTSLVRQGRVVKLPTRPLSYRLAERVTTVARVIDPGDTGQDGLSAAVTHALSDSESESQLLPHKPASCTRSPRDLADDVISLSSSSCSLDDEDVRMKSSSCHSMHNSAASSISCSEDAGCLLNTALTQHVPPTNDDVICHMPAGSYDIVLCVDTQETVGNKASSAVSRGRRGPSMLDELRNSQVSVLVRKLSVGDFLWLARDRTQAQCELVLPWVVERKRLDDLASSIRDQRYHEQKFRLSRCGLDNVVYLVEGTSATVKHIGLPAGHLNQAVANSEMIDGFLVCRTHDLRDSARFLTTVTHTLRDYYRHVDLLGVKRDQLSQLSCDGGALTRRRQQSLMTFAELQSGSCKQRRFSVRDSLARMLMLISGVSAGAAAAIVTQFPSVAALAAAYDHCDNDDARSSMLAHVQCADTQRRVGLTASSHIWRLFCDQSPA